MSRILVLTNSYDNSHVDAVKKHLQNMNHEMVRVDIDSILLGKQSLTWDFQSPGLYLTSEDRCINLLDVDSVWFRKPFGFGSGYGFAESIHDPVQRAMVEREVHDIVDALCGALSSKLWINHPKNIYQARLKPYQLHIARTVGINVPDSIITNNPDEARLFCAKGATVFKALAKQELDYGDVLCSIDTTLITNDHLELLNFIRTQPILLQRYIQKSAELRVTCIGSEIFVAKQTLVDDSDIVDWRLLQGTSSSLYEPWNASPELAKQIHSLIQALNLKFAAIDFAVDFNGQVWFLEVNPNGQWLGYTDEIGIPAAITMAKLLVP